MANLSKCRRCGVDLRPSSEATNQQFCGADCRDTWWNEQRSNRVTRSRLSEKIVGTKAPAWAWTDTQSAWLAALIDGEGSIGVWRERRPENKSGYRYRAVVEVFNTNKPLIDAIGWLTGGWSSVKRIGRDGHKTCYKLSINRRAVRPTLERVSGFLVAKKEQADRVLHFCRLIESGPVRGSRLHDVFEVIWSELKQLNKRGI